MVKCADPLTNADPRSWLRPRPGARPAGMRRPADDGSVSETVPTYTATWPMLSPSDRHRLDELDRVQTEVLAQLASEPADEVDLPMPSDLQVERVRVYRAAHARARRAKAPR